MFKLDRLRLSGFKSFVDPVLLDFAGGMTGIVGPNGCGKSNVSDAVCWVLGERSAKALRGQTMEDVIFAGTQARKSVGMAEVELTLLADPSIEQADDGQLTIGRRVFRSGDSQYTINGKTVRLKDIRDLLMGTGLGLRAYSVIEQGRIGQILSGKPQERRRLLEEAAGITKYKERRRIAEIKLEEARDNLSRLDDIVSEVERSLRSLKRQAGAARRFKERQSAYRELLHTVLLGRWSALHGRLAEAQRRLAELNDRDAASTAELQTAEAELLRGREDLDELAAAVATEHKREADLAARIEGKQEFLKGARQRLDEFAERVASGDAATEVRQNQLLELRASVKSLSGERANLDREREAAHGEVSEDEQKIFSIERDTVESEKRLEELRQRLLQSIGDVNRLRNRLHQEEVEQEKGNLRLQHLVEESASRLAELQQNAEQLSTAEAHLERQRSRERVLQSEFEQIEGTIAAAQERTESLATEREEAAERLRSLLRRKEVLEELAGEQRARRDDLRRALTEAGFDEPRFLGDHLVAPAGWERSLDLFLGELEDAVLLDPHQDGLRLAKTLTDGQTTGHLLVRNHDDGSEPVEVDDPAVGSSVAEALGLPQDVANALPPAFFVESRADAHRLARRHPGVAFISRDRLWATAGVLHIQGERARPGALARQHELEEIARVLEPLESKLQRLETELEESRRQLETAREQRDEQQKRLSECRQELAVALARHEDLAERQRRHSVAHQTLESERADTQQTLAAVADRSVHIEQDLGRNERRHQELEREFDAAQQQADSMRELRENTRTSGASRRGRLELIEHRLQAHAAELERAQRRIEEADQEITTWKQDRQRLEQRRGEITQAITGAEQELQRALEQRESAQEEVLERQTALDGQRAKLQELEEGIERRRGQRDELREEIAELRVSEAGLTQESEHLAAQMQEEFDEELPAQPAAPADEHIEMEADLTRLKDQLERTGPVNLLAAEEFDEQQERHTFLVEQRADVATSVDRLKSTIREINETSSERFMQTFLEVNESFGKTFTELFRGGQAEMRLMDEDDPLESGIEIVARPPGKRLQNIMLMSGGEKALTAIAVLFALFRTKPSPFCILDEVDAPLDDVNTLRFVEMLKQMSGETQFIVITHNKLTMEAMARLYGVTMQERGVSRLVSVDFDEIQPTAATA